MSFRENRNLSNGIFEPIKVCNVNSIIVVCKIAKP